MARSASDIVDILKKGTYSIDLPVEHIYDYEQIKNRRLYPSIEVVSTPNSTRSDKSRDELNSTFEVRIYIKRLGIMSDELESLELFEAEVEDLISTATLQDYRILFETRDWSRKDITTTSPSYIISTLKVKVAQVLITSIEPDGLLLFDLSASVVDTPPIADYQYLSVFDTEISDGYTGIEEAVTNNADDAPVHFSGIYGGTFITQVMVGFDDIGATSEKLNLLNKLDSNGEKPEFGLDRKSVV